MQVFHMDIEMQKTDSNGLNAIAVWCLTSNGKKLGETICRRMKSAHLFASMSLLEPADVTTTGFDRLSDAIADNFNRFSCHLFIFSTGIAVRILAPLIRSKLVDPAVVVLDDQGIHAISLLSGHIGKGNIYTKQIAEIIDAVPVITTATDVNNLPAIDVLAGELGLVIETPEAIKHINMAVLKGERIRIDDPMDLLSDKFPAHFIQTGAPDGSGPGVICHWHQHQVSRETLVLRPPVLSIGIGCNRDTPFEEIRDFLQNTLAAEHISRTAVFTLATTEIKNDEKGILELSRHLSVPVQFYSKEELNSVETIENPSQMVEKHLGVKSVCEAAAILGAGNGRLIVPKRKNRDVTLAVALRATGYMS